VEEKVQDIEASLAEQLRKITDMFKHLTQTTKGKNRSQKENRRKAKKRKASRNASNISNAPYISNAPLSQEVIKKDNLKLEALSNFSCSQVKYLRMIIVKGMLSTKSVSHTQEHVKDFLGSSDEWAGNAVIRDREDKENESDENDESVENDESDESDESVQNDESDES